MDTSLMLCKKADPDLLSSDEYYFEPKMDGTRALYNDRKLINRRGRSIDERYPEFDTFEKNIKHDCVIDGEVIVYNDKGLPDFNLLQSREQTSNKMKIELLSVKYPAKYVVFDCLNYRGKDITGETIEKRIVFLKKAVNETKTIQLIFRSEDGKQLWKKISDLGIEGVIAKKKGSKYYPGKRSRYWLKIKNLNTIDCIILGYTKGEGKREDTFGALILGAYKNGELRNMGKVGTGWTNQELINLKSKMDKLKVKEEENKVLIENKLVCEVEYLELTQNLDLRAPSFKRLRFDKKPEDCVILK
ncbi:MAG: DNA ligase [Candidatus Lokiarchaeota archaeon]|nr:DNA ligase [Candidatus Lokiarchaeota archaeon]